MHQFMVTTLDAVLAEFRAIQRQAREEGRQERPRWRMIVRHSPKGWTGPKEVDGVAVEGTWRAHQVPLPGVIENRKHRRQLEQWLQSCRPEELFDDQGQPKPALLAQVPAGAPITQPARARLQGGGYYHHTVRYGGAK